MKWTILSRMSRKKIVLRFEVALNIEKRGLRTYGYIKNEITFQITQDFVKVSLKKKIQMKIIQ